MDILFSSGNPSVGPLLFRRLYLSTESMTIFLLSFICGTKHDISASDSPESSQNESSNLTDNKNGSKNVNKNNCSYTCLCL